MNRFVKYGAFFLAGFMSAGAMGMEVLFDFENTTGGWKATQWRAKVEFSDALPVDGRRGLVFTHPRWRPEEQNNQQTWPAFATGEVPKDWTKFDRLVIPVYNDSAAEMLFAGFICDSKTPLQKGAPFSTKLGPYTGAQLVIPIRQKFGEKQINPADISLFHCFSENPREALTFYIDRIVLLEPGEKVPELPAEYLKKIKERQEKHFAPLRERIKAEMDRLNTDGLSPAIRQYLDEQRKKYWAALNDPDSNDLIISECGKNAFVWRQYLRIFQAAKSFDAIRPAVTASTGFESVMAGYAPPTEKVLSRCPGFEALPAKVELSAAGNEKESFQLVVLPTGSDLKSVAVKLSEFSGPAGKLPAHAVSAVPVGFIETKFTPIYQTNYTGFYSDPLLPFLNHVDVKRGEAQPFWVRADIPAEQAAGVYTGKATITIGGRDAFTVDIALQVYGFSLPEQSPLPLAVTFNPGYVRKLMPQIPDSKKDAVPARAWKKHRHAWAKMLSDYYITYDNLYGYQTDKNWQPDFEILAGLKTQGKLGRFNLGYFSPASDRPADNYGMQPTIDHLKQSYQKAKELGILDHAYIYGCDEINPDNFPRVNKAAAILKRELPGIPVFTTSYDDTYGMDGKLGSIDWFCPHNYKYRPEQAAAARKAGKQVWWYICAGPEVYPNNYIESSGIEPRLMMGAMTAKYRPDGFLYYELAFWNSLEPITSGPFVSFKAESYPNYNGDGMWVYPGPDSTPLASIRLENFRDGLEDYAYVKLLEKKLAAAEKSGADPDWCRKARAALEIPENLVANLRKHTQDLKELQVWRSRLADMIESAPAD